MGSSAGSVGCVSDAYGARAAAREFSRCNKKVADLTVGSRPSCPSWLALLIRTTARSTRQHHCQNPSSARQEF